MKKKNIFLLLSTMAVSALASCNSNSSSSDASSVTTSTAQSSQEASKTSEAEKSSSQAVEESSEIIEESSEPAASASEEISSQEASQEETSEATSVAATYNVELKNDNIVTIRSDKATAEEGEDVQISASVIAGYVLDEISVTCGETSVLVSKTESKWTFTMPAGNVSVQATYHRDSFQLSFADSHNTISEVLITPVGKEAIPFDAETKVEFEALITVSFTNTDTVTVTGVSLQGEGKTYNVNEENKVSFRMTAKDLVVEVLASVKDVELVSNDTDHLTGVFLDGEGNEIQAASKSETIYIRVDSDDAERYSVATIEITYNVGSNYSTERKDISSSYDEETGLYHFYIPNTSKLTLNLTERDAIAFQDSSIVGSYISTGLISKTGTYSKDNDWKTDDITIAASGQIISNNASYQIKELDDDTGVASLTNYASIYYGNKFVLVGNGNAGSVTTPYGSYDNIWVKKENAEDDDELYSNSLVTFTYGEETYRLLQVLRNGQQYASCFIDVTNEIAYFDVTFNFVNSTTRIHENKAQYEIKIDGVAHSAVGYKDEGGASNRIIMSGIYGDYTNETDVISFLGEGHAVFGGVTFTVVDNGDNTVSISSNTRQMLLLLNTEERTYSVLSDETVEASLAFKGHIYRGSFYNPWDECNNYFFMSFDATADTYISCVGTRSDIGPDNYSYGARYMSNNSDPYGNPLTQTYAYDAPSGTLTTTIFDCAQANGVQMTFVYSQAQNTFTCQTNYTSNMYVTRGMVMTLVE